MTDVTLFIVGFATGFVAASPLGRWLWSKYFSWYYRNFKKE